MRCIVLIWVCLMGCVSASEVHWSHEPLFTSPVRGDVSMTVVDPTPWSVELHSAVPVDIVAPQHGRVMDARVGQVLLQHHEAHAMLLLDDLQVHWLETGAYVCAGDTIGRSQQVRVRAYWGWPEPSGEPDISLVQVLHEGLATDLSVVQAAWQVQSVLGASQAERGFDAGQSPCPYEDAGEDE